MALVSLDANTCIWGIKEECTPGQEVNRDKAKRLVKRLSKASHRVILPAPVVSEISCRFDLIRQRKFLVDLSKKFEIGYLDAKATAILSELLHYNYDVTNHGYKELGITKKCMKYDAFIAAIAISKNAECIFTDDVDDFKAVVGGKIDIKGLDEMPSSDDLLENLRT